MSNNTIMGTDPLFPVLSNRPDFHGPDPLAFSLQSGLMVTSAVSTAVFFHLPDRLNEGPKTVALLAQETGTHEPSLYLLLRALAGIGIFAETDEQTHTFAQTERSLLLRSDAMADLVGLWGASYQWQAWQHLSYTIQTGRPALEQSCGEPTIWSYFNKHPQEREAFQRGLTAVSRLILPALLATYDFSTFRKVVDVGGGYGSLSLALLRQYPHLTAILFDLSTITDRVQQEIVPTLEEEIAHRYVIEVGDFFKHVPSGADCYVLKNVLMDWSDADYWQILQNCRQAMNEQTSRLLVIEPVIGKNTPFTKFFTLQMSLMMKEARHRTLEDHQALFASAGFRLLRALPLGLEYQIVEGTPIVSTEQESVQ